MDRHSLELFVFSILSILLMAALLGMLWAWVWALGRIWKGLPILADDHVRPFKPAPWGSLTVLSLVFLYLGVNLTVSRIYAAATGRHLPRVAKAAENQGQGQGQGDVREPDKAIDKSKNAEKAPLPGEATAAGQSNNVKSGPHDPGPDASTEQSLAELMIQFALSNGLLLVLVPAFVRLTSGAGLADLGLHRQEWPRQMGIGVRAAMLMTPLVCAIQYSRSPHLDAPRRTPWNRWFSRSSRWGWRFWLCSPRWCWRRGSRSCYSGASFSAGLAGWLRTGHYQPRPSRQRDGSPLLEPENESFFLNSKAPPAESTPIDPGSEILASSHQPAEPAFVAFLESADTTHLVLLRGHASSPVACA